MFLIWSAYSFFSTYDNYDWYDNYDNYANFCNRPRLSVFKLGKYINNWHKSQYDIADRKKSPKDNLQQGFGK